MYTLQSAQEFPLVALLNFLPLTKEGTLAGRGDGFHSQTDINLMKVQIALNTMKLFLRSEHEYHKERRRG